MSLINRDIIYTPSYEYGKQEVIKQNDFRYYKFNDILVPSVTSILRLSRPKQKFIYSSKQADSFEIGNLMHEYLDCYVTNKKIDDSDSENSKIAIKLSEVIINNIFPKVDSFISTEATVHNNHEYAGTLDLLALIDGKLTIIDYKSSYRQKSVDQIDEHFQQLAAYALAHDNMHSTKIEQAMIFVAYKESYKNDIYTADLLLLNHYKLMWNEALNYYKEISL
tara:strand:- start:1726 stop:2391 length:666 start_codon:yes stop_codon:yes gene_type:complete